MDIRGVEGASARCNSEMSVLAQANERQPGPGVQVGSFAHNTKGVSRIADKRKNGLFCPFCPFGGDAGSCSCISQGKSAYIVVCLAQRFGHR